MALEGEYEPSPEQWVRDQVDEYERSGGTRATTLRDTGLPVIVVTMRGNRTGKLRKTPLMRVEHDGEYALVASAVGHPPTRSGTTTSSPAPMTSSSRTGPPSSTHTSVR